jgi:7 transmembrane receptor (rhodopsin family)
VHADVALTRYARHVFCRMLLIVRSNLLSYVAYRQILSVTASVGTSTAIAVTRFVVVIYPLQRRHVGRRRSRLAIIISVWIASVLLSSVQLVVGRTVPVQLEQDVEVFDELSCITEFTYIYSLGKRVKVYR